MHVTCPACGHVLTMYREPSPSTAERIAARVADTVGSWWFAGSLSVLIVGWALFVVLARPFQPHPMAGLAILAATLSSLAALQGPLILLSQRRAATRDRQRDRVSLQVASRTEADLHEVSTQLEVLRTAVDRALAERGTGPGS